MQEQTQQQNSEVVLNSFVKGGDEGNRDLAVLRYMARKVRVLLRTLEQSGEVALPLQYVLEERQNQVHRIVILNHRELVQNKTISFVGFVSRQQDTLDPIVVHKLNQMDQVLVTELTNFPGFLGYSSLELCDGNWYNLVLMSGSDVKNHLLRSEAHKYAAYQLAPNYYEWIRLHSGTIDGGLAQGTFVIQTTKYYQFPGGFKGEIQRLA